MTSTCIINLWISAEHWDIDTWAPDDDIVDIVATLKNGDRWAATVCSYKHVQTLRAKWESSGECLGGRYLWAARLILSIDTSRESIEKMLNDLIANGEFESALEKLNAD